MHDHVSSFSLYWTAPSAAARLERWSRKGAPLSTGIGRPVDGSGLSAADIDTTRHSGQKKGASEC